MSTTTTTMPPNPRAPKRAPVPLLLEAFPAPPSHIPPTPTTPNNPPPSGPPSVPLPPVPGPSRLSEHEQLLLLSSAVNRSQRSSKYSVNSSHRESVASISSTGHGCSSSSRTSIASSGTGKSPLAVSSPLPNRDTSPRSGRPSLSISATSPGATTRTAEQLTRLSMSPIPLSDIEDEDGDLPPPVMPSPTLPRASLSSRRHHHPNESISSIDMRDMLGLRDEERYTLKSANVIPPSKILHHHQQMSLADPIDPNTIRTRAKPEDRPSHSPTTTTTSMHRSNSSIGSFSYPSSSKRSPITALAPFVPAPSSPPPSTTHNYVPSPDTLPSSVSTTTQLSSSSLTTTPLLEEDESEKPPASSTVSSPTVKDVRLGLRAGRTRSAGLKHVLNVRSRSRSRLAAERERPPEPGVGLPPVPNLEKDPRLGLGLGLPDLGVILVTKTTKVEVVVGAGQQEMTLDELGPVRKKSVDPPPVAFPEKEEDSRAVSPDIASILSSTPRPALTKSASSRPRARTRINSAASGSGRRHVSEGVHRSRFSAESGVRRVSEGSSGSRESDRHVSWERRRRLRSLEGEEEEDYDEELERVLEGEGSEDDDARYPARGRKVQDDDGDSDSSLDLHTPLPNLMVRHGLLSPNSKLLPGAASRSATPLDGRPGSTMSLASNGSMMTKGGIIKDERDTPMRRVRHRDGKLLRGGIGLTTGLGWSDSEDEDAPSPLTHRLSKLNLARRSSASSIMTGGTHSRSSHPQRHPLSHSYSSGPVLETHGEHRPFDGYDEYDDDEEDNALQESGEWAQRQRLPPGGKPPRSSLPPTSWQRRTTSGFSRSSTGTRTSTSSVGSTFSLEVTTPEGQASKTPSRIQKPGVRRDSTSSSADHHARPPLMKRPSRDEMNTPSSTASTLSIPMPPTPKDTDPLSTSMSTPLAGSRRRMPFDKEKTLPPLPPGGLKKMPSISKMEISVVPSSKMAFPRARTFSSTSSASMSTSSPPPTATSPAVRPLQLPRHAARAGDRPAVPVPSVLSSSTSRGSLRSPGVSPTSPESGSSSPLPSPTSMTRPKPRTGTGMVYRTTSSIGLSKMRPPMTLSSSASALGGNALSSGPAVGSIGRANISRAIAL